MTTLFHYFDKALSAGRGDFKVMAKRNDAGAIEFGIYESGLEFSSETIVAAFTLYSDGRWSNNLWLQFIGPVSKLLNHLFPPSHAISEESGLGKLQPEMNPELSSPPETPLSEPCLDVPMPIVPDIQTTEPETATWAHAPTFTPETMVDGVNVFETPTPDYLEPAPPTDNVY